jgi:hemerythrin-like domain-containing protein
MTRLMTDEQPDRLFAEREHLELARGLNRIHEVASHVDHVATPTLSDELIDVVHWLDRTLEPHLAWEDRWLYPEVERRLGTPWATCAARFEHGTIRGLGDRLREDRLALPTDLHAAREELRAHLFGLETLVRTHVEWEERYLLPVLDEPALELADASAHRIEAVTTAVVLG